MFFIIFFLQKVSSYNISIELYFILCLFICNAEFVLRALVVKIGGMHEI